MQKIYIFFYRLISNEGNITFHKIELQISGELLHLENYKVFEELILTLHPKSTIVEITGSMYLREIEVPLTTKPPIDVINTTGKKRVKLRKSK